MEQPTRGPRRTLIWALLAILLALGAWYAYSADEAAVRPSASVAWVVRPRAAPEQRSYQRPEERGESLLGLPAEQLLGILAETSDRILARKAAIALGDWNLATGQTLTGEQADRMRAIVGRWLAMCESTDVHTRSEGRQQVLRAWRTAADGLIEQLSNPAAVIRETAARSLIDMRDEAIVRRMVGVARTTESEEIRSLICRSLAHVGDNTRLAVPRREIMGAQDTEALFAALVEPALEELGYGPLEGVNRESEDER